MTNDFKARFLCTGHLKVGQDILQLIFMSPCVSVNIEVFAVFCSVLHCVGCFRVAVRDLRENNIFYNVTMKMYIFSELLLP